MKSGSSNVSTAYLAGMRSRDELKTSRLGPSRDHATVVCETFHTVSEGVFSEVREQRILRGSLTFVTVAVTRGKETGSRDRWVFVVVAYAGVILGDTGALGGVPEPPPGAGGEEWEPTTPAAILLCYCGTTSDRSLSAPF
jgi:hypothetical protein